MSTMTAVGPARTAIFLSALLVATAAPLAAQGPVEVRMALFGGVLDPRGDLPHAPILSSPTNIVTYDDFEAVPTLGVAFEMSGWSFPAVVRLSALRSFGGEEVGHWGCAEEDGDPLPCPSILLEVETDVTTTLASAALVGEVAAGPVTFRPLIGVGWVRYLYTWDAPSAGPFSLAPGKHTDDSLALHYGVGIAVPAGPFRMEAGYTRYRSDTSRIRPDRTGTTTFGLSTPIG